MAKRTFAGYVRRRSLPRTWVSYGKLALGVLLVVAGCSRGGAPNKTLRPPTSEPSLTASIAAPPSHNPADDLPQLRALAKSELDAWNVASATAKGQGQFVPEGKLTGQVRDWERASLAASATEALVSDNVTAGSLPVERPPDGQVHWASEAQQDVVLISARRAFAEIHQEGFASGNKCGTTCIPIRFTGAKLTTVDIQTTFGMATAPAWEFTLDNSSVRITRLAVAREVSSVPPYHDPFSPVVALSIESAIGSASGRDLAVEFTGAGDDASQPCGADYTTEPVESANAIVVILVEHPNTTYAQICPAVGHRRIATVHLAAALGIRSVLENQRGQPVEVTLLP